MDIIYTKDSIALLDSKNNRVPYKIVNVAFRGVITSKS